MKTVCFITGTNGVGKTTLANAIIEHYGGVCAFENKISYLKEGGVSFVGKYEGQKYGGVDWLNETKRLPYYVGIVLQSSEIVFCEGKFLKSFSLPLQEALFLGQRQFVFNLFASPKLLYDRLLERGGGGANMKYVIADEYTAMRNAKLWKQIGVNVLQFDTGLLSVEQIKEEVLCKINSK